MKTPRKKTIYDISALAGVSASTVASVLNGSWKRRRITEKTAEKVRKLADELGYTTNLQARGLRISSSGLVGMILPMLDNRYFSSLAASFETIARSRNLVPAVVSTLREPEEERNTVEALIAHNVDALFIAGATDPDSVAKLCEAAQLKYINVDLPGKHGISVISDSYEGARGMTAEIIHRSHTQNRGYYFIGGVETDYNTSARIAGFVEALASAGIAIQPDTIQANGYDPAIAEATIRSIYKKGNGLPDVLFVNSTIVFEGIVRFLKTLPVEEVRKCSIGCYDWDPFIELLHFPVVMVRQNVQAMMERAYALLDEPETAKSPIERIPTELIMPLTAS
ncbi:LacI family DNA-binding transcriptional regulator [Falsochrobactrum sp. TDYN1]|uniref:LacI family DNA-binding transcriptional regulator n=1 Tax=Falsochrobactrum tianjinense TaxID=2706015 RepID=A0A949PLR0_9HYPH|nr:LacI family DNA-binding transcriptional regulator [Falsochrobactrum sp. TDYN1]MBV2143601.1 LacI family DNA-binding transcriptional regulator [Falsochrobactrum sp. TDYN1]